MSTVAFRMRARRRGGRLRPAWRQPLAIVGSVIAVGLFVATISFIFTTPGVGEESAGGFPLLSMTGEFLIKDVALLGIAVWTLADALNAARRGDSA